MPIITIDGAIKPTRGRRHIAYSVNDLCIRLRRCRPPACVQSNLTHSTETDVTAVPTSRCIELLWAICRRSVLPGAFEHPKQVSAQPRRSTHLRGCGRPTG